MLARETRPLLPPGFQKLQAPLDSYTTTLGLGQSTPTHQLAFASCWEGTVLWEYLPAPQKNTKLLKNAKLQIASTTCSSPSVDES